MAFGQSSGPPATNKQVQELLTLLHEAGHSDFRDARGPMGFNQRQAAGKFTREEADAFIEQLQQAAEDGVDVDETASRAAAPIAAEKATARAPIPKAPAKPSTAEQTLRKYPSEMLAAELQRRGWVVLEP